MQKTITLLLSIAFFSLQAQITITSADMPSVNDTVRYSNSFLDSIARTIYQTGGANTTWDFSTLRPIRQQVKSYKRAINTPYGFFFLGFNRYGVKELDSLGFGNFKFEDVYLYFKNDNNEFQTEGIGMKIGGVPIPSYYSDEDEIYQFPLRYGRRDSSTFAYRLSLIGTGAYGSKGYRINEVDGWGKITTPFGTFDCIRVKSEIVAKDSIELFGVGFSLPNIRREYKWLARGGKIPILEISGNVVFGDFIPTLVRYKDQYRNIEFSENLSPTVDFEANLTIPSTFDTVQFTSYSTELALHEWFITPNTYQFLDNTNANSRNPKVRFTAAGNYDISLKVTNPVGVADTTFLKYIQVSVLSDVQTLEKEQQEERQNIRIFPNPIVQAFTLSYSLKTPTEVQVQLWSGDGKLLAPLLQEQATPGEHQHYFTIPSMYSNGLYWLKIQIGQQTTWQKLVRLE